MVMQMNAKELSNKIHKIMYEDKTWRMYICVTLIHKYTVHV